MPGPEQSIEEILTPYIRYKVGDRVRIIAPNRVHGTQGKVIRVTIFDRTIYYEVDNGILPDPHFHEGQFRWLLRGDQLETL